MKVEFVPVRWRQVASFIRLNLEVMQDRDPWAARVLARPWTLSNLIEYGYILLNFAFSDAYFIVVSGERVGVLWLTRRSRLLYLHSIGLASQFRTGDVGMLAARLLIQVIRFIEDYAEQHHCDRLVLRIRVDNTPPQRLARLFHCRPLGLAVTTLTLHAPVSPSAAGPTDLDIRPLRRSKAARAWDRWRLYGVEQVAGSVGVEVATSFLKSFYWMYPLPRGKYLALYQNGEEVGFAFARRGEDGLELGLFPRVTYYSESSTALLVGALASYLRSPIRHLTLTQSHADALKSASFEYDRHQEKEWMALFRLADPSLMQAPDDASSGE